MISAESSIEELLDQMWDETMEHRYDSETKRIKFCDCAICSAISIVAEYIT